MAAITYGTSHIEGERSFRIPFGMFFVVPIIVAAGACFIREVSGRAIHTFCSDERSLHAGYWSGIAKTRLCSLFGHIEQANSLRSR